MRLLIHNSIEEIAASEWQTLTTATGPFLRHEFLLALEQQRCIGGDSGWLPRYFAWYDDSGLCAAVPAYLKWHSYGEFVFDFAWAQAYNQYGLDYYPKLSIAIPFTPATGQRVLHRADRNDAARTMLPALQDYAAEHNISSIHALFLNEADRQHFEQHDWLLRRDCQFHWRNRDYQDFEHYLSHFTAEKRKKARRERRRVQEQGIEFATYTGASITPALLDRVYDLKRRNFLRHGHEPYLSRGFFQQIARTMGEDWLVSVAQHDSQAVAAAIFFKSSDTLYGRYWGAADDYHSLHFETCYHQGIELCIRLGLTHFEPGTQGEHKISRGFEPTLTWSAHYVVDARFRSAIKQYLNREAAAVDAYAAEVQNHLPFRAAE
jgi:uncharacterized protein